MTDGSICPGLFFVVEGRVEVRKHDPQKDRVHTVRALGAGDFFGESCLAVSRPASADVVSASDCVLLFLPREQLRDGGLSDRLARAVLTVSVARLESVTSYYAESLSARLEQQIRAREFGHVYVVTMLIVGLHRFVKSPEHITEPIAVIGYSWAVLAVGLLPVLLVVWRMGAPLSTYGVGLENWRRSAAEGLLAGGLLATVFVAAHASMTEGPLFTFKYLDGWPPVMVVLFVATYIVHSYLQEFVMRGVMQGSLQRFMVDSHWMTPILIISLLFGLLHVHKSVGVGVMTFLGSLGLGYIYYRHGNLIGVTLVHIILGLVAQGLGYF